ncbi:unnamed protein product [Gadus morhua 'NCC']
MQGKSLDEFETEDELAVSDAEANDGSDSEGSDTADLPTEFGTSEPEPVKTGSDRPASQANPPCHQGEPAVRHQTALKVKTGSDRPASQANPPCHQGEPAEKILAKNMGPGERQRRTPTPGRRLGPFRGIAASDSRPAPQEGSDQRHGECEGPADRPPRKDLSQVMGNVRIRVKGLRKQRVETLTTALPDLEEVKPLDRLSRRNPFRRIKMAWAETKAVIATNAPPNSPEQQDLVIEAGEDGEATQQAEGKGLRPRINKWLNLRMKDLSTFAARSIVGQSDSSGDWIAAFTSSMGYMTSTNSRSVE